jgi:Asp-tRNA(Asn)/Glu-tRNA(Gln) amidotransferase A subunit family amidase
LEEAGAILLAKVTLGALAWGDEWFGGTTRNPWEPSQGSSGSSAGTAASVAAGLASFGLGSETLGSIVSPSRRCRTSGLRPTYGRVSRAGCMPLAWSMDKIGPIARHTSDLAFVFSRIIGRDARDATVVDRSFSWPIDRSVRSLRIGIPRDLVNPNEQEALAWLKSQGADIVELDLASQFPVKAMNFCLAVEATTVFDNVFRADRNANYGKWSKSFLQSRFIPAVDYLRAQRMRGPLIMETERKLATVDVMLGGDDLLLTNLTGHPSIIVSCGTDRTQELAMPGVVKLTAAAYQEEMLLHVACALQAALPPTPAMPPLDKWLAELAAAPS